MRSTPSWTPPNKRLKLPGGDRFKGTLSVVPWRARSIVQLDGALRAGRPQLKRDPLGCTQRPLIDRALRCYAPLITAGADSRRLLGTVRPQLAPLPRSRDRPL